MIVNNYWKLRNYVDRNSYPNTSSYVRYSFGLRFKNPYDTTVMLDSNVNVLTTCADSRLPWNYHKNLYMRVGSGTDSPTLDDYWMMNDITDSFLNYTSTSIIIPEGNKSVLRFTTSGSNPTENTIRISEISICKQLMVNYGLGYANYEPYIMFVHEILNEPIDVLPRNGFTMSFDWKNIQ